MTRRKILIGIMCLTMVGVSWYQGKRVADAQAEVELIREAVPKVIDQTAQIGFLAGCMMATVSITRMDNSDPIYPVYQDACLQGSKGFAAGLRDSE
jgi:hypothetical protein